MHLTGVEIHNGLKQAVDRPVRKDVPHRHRHNRIIDANLVNLYCNGTLQPRSTLDAELRPILGAKTRPGGWGVALDDVGADSMSLAFMPLLRPDVVKLDLRLVQERPGAAVAEIMNAVNAYAERTGALDSGRGN